MQDKYAGDVGDFGKLILLSQVMGCAIAPARLGINWYKVTREEPSSNDGRHVHYLDHAHKTSQRYYSCAPDVYRKLGAIISDRDRSIRRLECSGILPADTIFYSDSLPDERASAEERELRRGVWFEKSSRILQDCNIIFLDPDNGIQPHTMVRRDPRALKYAFIDEIHHYFSRSDLLIVYNHRDRTPADRYAAKFLSVRGQLGGRANMRIMRYQRVSVRDYVFLYKEESTGFVERMFDRLCAPPFDFLFRELHVPLA